MKRILDSFIALPVFIRLSAAFLIQVPIYWLTYRIAPHAVGVTGVVPIVAAGMTCSVTVTVTAALLTLPWGALLALVLGGGLPYLSAKLVVSVIGTGAGVAFGVLLSMNRKWCLQLREEVNKARSLGGVLHMCPACNRVALGVEEWMPMEAFLKSRSRAMVDHHVCPVCADRFGRELLLSGGKGPGDTFGEFRDGEGPGITEARGESLPVRWRTALLLLAVLSYVFSFRMIHVILGYGENITALIPVMAAAWFFRPITTIIVGLITFPANIMMSLWLGTGWDRISGHLAVSIAGTLTVILVGGLISRNRTIYRQLRRIRQRVKVLSGLLPVCPFCRRVHDDDGSWQGMEDFIHRHSGADFIHSLCPECVDRLNSGDKSQDWTRYSTRF